MSLCCSVCEDEKTQILDPLKNSKFLSLRLDYGNLCVWYEVLFTLTKLKRKLDRFGQGPSQSPQWLPETSDTSGDESDSSRNRKRTIVQKDIPCGEKLWGRRTWEIFCPFYFHICRKHVSVLTCGHYEILRFFQGLAIFPAIRGSVLKQPGGEFWTFKSSPWLIMSCNSRWTKSGKALLLIRILNNHSAKIWSWMKLGRLTRTCPIDKSDVSRPCSAVRIELCARWETLAPFRAYCWKHQQRSHLEPRWSPGEFCGNSRTDPYHFEWFVVVLLLVDHHQWNAATDLVTCNQVDEGASTL